VHLYELFPSTHIPATQSLWQFVHIFNESATKLPGQDALH